MTQRLELGLADGKVIIKGNVSSDKVIQEDAKTPDCQLVSIVALLQDPFWRSIDSGACEYILMKSNFNSMLPSKSV